MAALSPLSALWSILALRRARPERDPEQARIPYSGRTQAGVFVTPDRALSQATVWACHRYLTQTIAQLPVRVLRVTNGKGASERVAYHPVNAVFNWRASPEYSPFQLKETLTGWALLWGNGYAEIERDGAGRVLALHPIQPWRVDARRDLETGDLFYEVNNGTRGKVDIAAADMFHLRGFGNDAVGLSVVEYAAQSIGWAQATELFGASFFGEGLNPAGVIEPTAKLNEAGAKRLRAELDGMYKGPRKSNRWVLLEQGMKWTKMQTRPDEAQFIQSMQHQVEEICRWFGVPPQKVGHLLRMTFNNVEQLSIEVVVDSITPWAIRWEEEANYKLFGQNRQSMFVKLDLKGLLRGDFKSRQEGLQIQRRNGIISGDEWRDYEDMGPMDGEGGEIRIVEGNMTRLERVGEAPEPVDQPQRPADQPDSPDEEALAAVARMQVLTDQARGAMNDAA